MERAMSLGPDMGPVEVMLKVNCGCGFRTEDLEAAKSHAHFNHHILTIYGEVKEKESA